MPIKLHLWSLSSVRPPCSRCCGASMVPKGPVLWTGLRGEQLHRPGARGREAPARPTCESPGQAGRAPSPMPGPGGSLIAREPGLKGGSRPYLVNWPS